MSALKVLAGMAMVLAGVVGSAQAQICTPATINPGAPERIRPHMPPQAVSAVLGCLPTEIPLTLIGVWIWGIPLLDAVGTRVQLAVAFDEAGALSANYQYFPPFPVGQGGNSRLRVEPGLPPFWNWVPGVAAPYAP